MSRDGIGPLPNELGLPDNTSFKWVANQHNMIAQSGPGPLLTACLVTQWLDPLVMHTHVGVVDQSEKGARLELLRSDPLTDHQGTAKHARLEGRF